MKMISLIGNKLGALFLDDIRGITRLLARHGGPESLHQSSNAAVLQSSIRKKRSRGFSFMEMMVTLVILTSGLILIYRTFFLALDYSSHVAYRLHALSLIDEKISSLERLYMDLKQLPVMQSQEVQTVSFDHKKIEYSFTVDIKSLEELNNILEVNVSLAWQEGNRQVRLSRSVYIANYSPAQKLSNSVLPRSLSVVRLIANDQRLTVNDKLEYEI